MAEIPASRLRYAWESARPWILGRELLFAVVITVIDAAVELIHHHFHLHKWWAGGLDYLWTFLTAAVILGLVRFAYAVVIHPWQLLAQRLESHLESHADTKELATRLDGVDDVIRNLGAGLTQLRTAVASQPYANVTVQAGGVVHMGGGGNAQEPEVVQTSVSLDSIDTEATNEGH